LGTAAASTVVVDTASAARVGVGAAPLVNVATGR
jgi:hypothetical protein